MFYYQFRVDGIQGFILATNRLKEMVGASALVDQLTSRDIFSVIEAAGLPITRDDFARCAGGTFLVQIERREDAEALRDLWSFFVAHKLPGLGFCHALVEAARFDEATERALTEALQDGRLRSLPPLPVGSPFAERAPRTGLPATTVSHGMYVDAPCYAKQQAAAGGASLEQKLALEGADELVFPLSFVPHENHDVGETLLGENESDQYVAVIHADGNGLGDVVKKLNKAVAARADAFPRVPAEFSAAIERATHKAVRKACLTAFQDGLAAAVSEPHKKVAPLRILVLGGDDVTLVTRARHALAFVRCFQEAFKQETEAAFAELDLPELPAFLTASAGVAFIKAKQPFHMAYALSESLCRHAKKAGRAHTPDNAVPPALLAFHRVTTAMIDDWATVVKREKTTRDRHVLTMQPYMVHAGFVPPPPKDKAPDAKSVPEKKDSPPFLPCLIDLYELHDVLAELGRGPVRELQKTLYLGESHTLKAQRRWRENLAKRAPRHLARLELLLARLTGRQTDDQPDTSPDPGNAPPADCLPLFDQSKRSPLADAIALAEIGGAGGVA